MCTDKHLHAEVVNSVCIYMFFHLKHKSQLHNLLKRHSDMILETCNFVREKRTWLGKGKEVVLIIKDRLRQSGVWRVEEKGGFTSKRHRNIDPSPSLPTRFQVHWGSDSMKTDSIFTLAGVPVKLNKLLQSRQCPCHKGSSWHNHLGRVQSRNSVT